MTAEEESKLIQDFFAAFDIEYGVGIFRRRDGKIIDLNITPGIMEKAGLVEMLHRGVQTEINVMTLDRIHAKEDKDAAERSCPDGAPVPPQE